jgi:hypothetical protein
MTEVGDGDAKVRIAFGRFRAAYGPARPPKFMHDPSEGDEMTVADGLEMLVDGPDANSTTAPAALAPMSEATLPAPSRLWAVRPGDVVHAPIRCEFGDCRAAKEVKHSNLTGGGKAFGGGELMVVDSDTIIVNGRSGRYGPRSADEMHAVAVAFRDSGYIVYSMGYDEGTARPFGFIGGPRPELV